MDGWIGEGGFPRWALHQRRNFSRVAEAGKPETVAGGILVALEPVEHHNGWQLRQWSWRCMVPVANVQARGEGLLVDTMVSGQGFQAYLREPEYPTRLWRRGWTKPERQARGSPKSPNDKPSWVSTRRRGAPTRAPKACFCPRLGLYHLEPQPLSAGWLLRATAFPTRSTFTDWLLCCDRSAPRAKMSIGK